MADQPKNPRSLSEISHLFLSGVREKQMGGRPMPQRKAPAPNVSVDLTPEEFQQVLAEGEREEAAAEETKVPPVRAVIAAHLGEEAIESAKRYARNLAAWGRRVGLIVIDVAAFRLMVFDPAADAAAEVNSSVQSGCLDVRAMADAINELNCDLDCWLVLAANPKIAEARSLLRAAARWVVLTRQDNEGIIASYRALKGLADLHRPRLSLAVLDAKEPAEAEQVFRKLCGVCAQFLNWTIETEPAVGDALHVVEIPVMCCDAGGDKAQLASAKHWEVVAELLAESNRRGQVEMEEPAKPAEATASRQAAEGSGGEEPAATVQARAGLRLSGGEEPAATVVPAVPVMRETTSMPEVIELPAGDGAILAAVMRHSMNEVIECPLRPPMCPEARLAVSRDRRVILVAMAGHGLRELKSIGQAYRWVVENRGLLAMAMPQFALDAHQLPHLRLLVDQSDVDAELLQPIFQMNTVMVHTYCRVRWGERTGLLLKAA